MVSFFLLLLFAPQDGTVFIPLAALERTLKTKLASASGVEHHGQLGVGPRSPPCLKLHLLLLVAVVVRLAGLQAFGVSPVSVPNLAEGESWHCIYTPLCKTSRGSWGAEPMLVWQVLREPLSQSPKVLIFKTLK